MASPNPSFNDRQFAQRAAAGSSLMPHDDRLTLRQSSFSSDSSTASQVTALAVNRRSPYAHDDARAAASASSLASTLRPVGPLSSDLPFRQPSPASRSPSELNKHRTRHSQGFFEPTLPTASFSQSPGTASLSASQIAAQAAISSSHARRRSQTIPDQQPSGGRPTGRHKPSFPPPKPASPTLEQPMPAPPHTAHPAGTFSTTATTAATAANAAYPRSPLYSPAPPFAERMPSPASDRDQRSVKEKARRKIFSKPKAIMASSKDDRKSPAMPSPSKMSFYTSNPLSRLANQSTSSLNDSVHSSASSIYSSNNASTSTLVPSTSSTYPDKEKDRPRHHFLSRKPKVKDRDDQFTHSLSSASSNSRPADPAVPLPLYSFSPASPAPQSTFDRSISGLDLRHGGRALREKRKQEKSAATVTFAPNPTSAPTYNDASDWLNVPSALSLFGPSSATSNISQGAESGTSGGSLVGLSLTGMSVEDAWPLLQARILNIFEGEDIRIPVEDFNRLVSVHLQRCIQRRAPAVILDDLCQLLCTGFSSLDQTLRQIPDERLVLNLVDMWLYVFGTILPFMQAIFLPLDLELRGHGPLLSARESADFWKPVLKQGVRTGLTSPGPAALTRTAIDVRTIVLLAFRNTVILPRHATLLAIFSRLSLDSINALPLTPNPNDHPSVPPRPGTAASSTSAGTSSVAAANLNPAEASFTSQSSTLLDSNNSASIGARSRATSNTSAGSFHSNGSQSQRHVPGLLSSLRPQGSTMGAYDHAFSNGRDRGNSSPGPVPPMPAHAGTSVPIMDPAKVTETAGRMLQCISVLASLPETGIGPGLTRFDFAVGNNSSTSQPSASAMASTNSSTTSSSTGASVGTTTDEAADDDESVAVRRKMERLAKELKLNWLGRGRTGRNRRGFVGTRVIRNVGPDGIGLGTTANTSANAGLGLGIGVGA